MTKSEIKTEVAKIKKNVDATLKNAFKQTMPASRQDVADLINVRQIAFDDPQIKSFKMLDKDCVSIHGHQIAYAMSMTFKGHTKPTIFADQITA